jgi:hypothetical protein
MKPYRLLASSALLCLVLLPVMTPSCGGSTTTPSTGAGSGSGGSAGSTGSTGASGSTSATDTCLTNDDCTWGEISKEILSATDCICLYGCPYLPQTKVTATRRGDQYKALCDPRTNGKGQPCGIDDCALPGPISCINGTCQHEPVDAGQLE